MQQLSETWFVDGFADFELQQYRLKAYLQAVARCFAEQRLYPSLRDVTAHYRNLLAFREQKHRLQDRFPKVLRQVDVRRAKLLYEQLLQEDALMKELEEITAYAAVHLKEAMDRGAEIHDAIERQVVIEPVGILPLYKREGYLLLEYGGGRRVLAYAFNHTLLDLPEPAQALRLRYLSTFTVSAAVTYVSIKKDLMRAYPTLPQPAVYVGTTPLSPPLHETLLPVVRQSFLRVLE